MVQVAKYRKNPPKDTRLRRAFKDSDFTYGFSSSNKTDGIIEKMTSDLIAYARATPAPKNIHDFYLDRDMSSQTYYDLLEKYPKMKRAHEQAMSIIGNRLWEGAVDKRSDWAPVKWRLHRYDKEFKEIDEYHVAMAAKSKGTDTGTDREVLLVKDCIKSEQ